jgi:hypothetical protein
MSIIFDQAIYHLPANVGFKPWSNDPIETWESWLADLKAEKASLENICAEYHLPEENVDYEIDGLDKVRRAIEEAKLEIAAAKRLAAAKPLAVEEKPLAVEEDVEHRADRMASETENFLLEGLVGFEQDPQEMLKPWVPSWYPNPDKEESGGMFICETGREKWLGLIPDGVMPDSTHKSNFTYYPDNSGFSTDKKWGRSLGPWGGGIQELPWWQGWNLVGHGVLIMLRRHHVTIGNPNSDGVIPTHRQNGHNFYHGTKFYLECEEDQEDPYREREVNRIRSWATSTVPDYCWMFALVDAWDGELKKHNLVFLDRGVFYTVSEVNLRNCVFQEWTRPSLRRFKGSPSGEEENYSTSYSGFGVGGDKQPGELWKSVPYPEDDLEEGEIRE